MDILALLFPKEKKFYRMVEKQVMFAGSVVSDFHRLINTYEKLNPALMKRLVNNIGLKEKQDDKLYIEMVRALKSTFITPIDREDLLRLVSTFVIIMDSLEMITFKINIFKIKKMDKKIKEQTEILSEEFRIIEKLIFSMRNENQVEQYCLKMRKLEQKGDQIYVEGLEKLFSDSLQPTAIIKLKDLYSSMEKIIDKIYEASHIIENISVKYS